MKYIYWKLFLLFAFVAFGGISKAQLPNEKFGKPSDLEWNYQGWGDAVDADAIVLCKTMTMTYELNEQFGSAFEGVNELNVDNMQSLGKNMVGLDGIVVNHDFKLRIKILKPNGIRHANVDIVYQDAKDLGPNNIDELLDLKVKVFSKNEKGKIIKKNINTNAFARERVDDNYKVVHVVVPDVQPGSIIEYTYKIRSPRGTFLYDWSFQECIPVVHSKCDIEIPAFLKFNMNVPINTRQVKSNVVAGTLLYDQNRTDMKDAKRCLTNHYTIVGDYILPEGFPIKHNQDITGGGMQVKVANFTSRITNEGVAQPMYMPESVTHLKIRE